MLLDNRRGRFIAVTREGDALATGGGATMYHICSPSLEKAADGQAMASRAGAEFVDMEMMQFHPTGLLVGNSIATGGLLEEGLRGAGARLYNALGERYMERYAPDKLERATRDVVCRTSYMEIMAGRGTPSGGVLIDATHLDQRLRRPSISPAWSSAAASTVSIWCTTASKSSPSATTTWAASASTSTATPTSKASSPPAKTQAASTAPIASAATASPIPSSSAPRRRQRWPTFVAGRDTRPASPTPQIRELGERWAAAAGAGERRECLSRFARTLEDLMWEKVGVVRNGTDLERRRAQS